MNRTADPTTAESMPLPGARAGRDPSRALKRGPSRLPPEVVAATQRDRLFDALVHTVAAKGYANARVSDICQAAGVTRPAFYALFDGKEDAFLATYRHGISMLLGLMEAAHREAPDWRASARATLSVMLNALASVPDFARMAIVEVDSAGPAARHERDSLIGRFGEFFADAPMRDPAPAREDLATAVVGGIYCIVYRHVAAGRVAQLPEMLPSLTYFVLVPFLGREEAAREWGGEPGPADLARVP
ncbi:MAG TPA: TetR/AcrR family transcriptional regulator [Rugosimonospora sp.]|nr:TetR/AcrR family transcriptional regulator [Rugosimonospora sp.]